MGIVASMLATQPAVGSTPDALAPPTGMVHIPDGVFHPLFTSASQPDKVPVKAFCLDILPVTVGDFLEFVRANPCWRRSQVKPIFADDSYLKNWSGDLDPGTNAPLDAPVIDISWFAAKAYADWKGKRLPTVAEWEYAAAAGFSGPDGQNEPAFKKTLEQWYSTPSAGRLPAVGHSRANYWKVHDLHGLVWEWTSDFNSAMVNGDARSDGLLDRQLFCGSGSQGAKDPGDYPAFMRYGLRSSLKAAYCLHNLGFRCAADLGSRRRESALICSEDQSAPTHVGGYSHLAPSLSRRSIYQLASGWTTDTGQSFKLSNLRGKPQVVAMIFTSCQGACPVLVNELRQLAAALPASQRRGVGFLLITFDSEHDTPKVLHQYRLTQHLPENQWTLLHGRPEDVRELALVLGFKYRAEPGGIFSHSNLITILNEEGEVSFQETGLGNSPDRLAQHLARLLTPNAATAPTALSGSQSK